MKKFCYVGLLVYVFWMDEEKKKPVFEAIIKGSEKLSRLVNSQ